MPGLLEFVNALSQILPDADVDAARQAAAGMDSEDALADSLVQDGQITRFQADAILIGDESQLRFGEYVLLDKIGAGGMGVVYKAQHRRMKRLVAIKQLPPRAAANEALVKRFYREVEVAAQLTHPNIVTAYDAGENDGQLYLVMEYVDGHDLASVVADNGPLPIADAVLYLLQAARGLTAAHDSNIVHRDIKPSNMLLSNDGQIKLLDMGLARLSDQEQRTELTAADGLMGTAEYMAPEQAEDPRNADARSDIYSLGYCLYWMLAARSPYHGASVMQMLLAHRDHPVPSLMSLGFEDPIAPALEQVYLKMVAKQPAERFQRTSDVVKALERLLETDHRARPKAALPVAPPPPRVAPARASTPVPKTHVPEAPATPQAPAPNSAAPRTAPPTVYGANPRGLLYLILAATGLMLVLLVFVGILVFRDQFKSNPAEPPAQSNPTPTDPKVARPTGTPAATSKAGTSQTGTSADPDDSTPAHTPEKGPEHSPPHNDPLARGLYLHYSFDAIQDDVVVDQSPHQRNGQLHGSCTKERGIHGVALRFDGPDDLIDPGPGFEDLRSGFTFALWVKPDIQKHSFGRFIHLGNGNPFSENISFGRGLPNTSIVLKINPRRGAGARSLNKIESHKAIFNGAWQHFATTLGRDGYAVIYRDGKRLTDGRLRPPPVIKRSVNHIGGLRQGTSNFYAGLIDEVRIYSRVLSDDEVLRLYQRTVD